VRLLKRIGIFSVRSRRVVALGLLVIAVAVFGVATLAWAKHNPTTVSVASAVRTSAPPISKSETANAPATLPAESGTEVEVVTLRAGGFEPDEIVRPAGRFILAVSNHSGTTGFVLHLDRVNGNRLQEVNMPKGRVRWNPLVDLPPGEYQLTEQSNPAWVCRIKLTPR